MIDTSENLIIIKGQIKTPEIESCQNHNGNYKVVFRNVPSAYTYKEENVLWLTDPDKPDPNNYQIISKGRTLSNIKALSIFKAGSHNYWHIRFLNGKEYDYREKDLEIIESCLGESRSKSIFKYLKKVADANELKADDGTKLLAKQYEKIHFIANNRAIAVYLNPQKYKMQTRTASTLIFPFGCNASQQKAVQAAFENQISVVQGPPGTGKTTTLVEAIYETLHREPQVLVCAQSNTAVDWICEKLVDRGVPVLRIGNPTRVNDKMLSSTYERRFESHPAYPELWGIRKSIREMGSRMRRGSYSEREGMRNRMSRLRERATELEIQINADLFDSARVIASTLVSSNHRLLNGRRFSTLFIDEAAQALEAACWIAIRKADRVILAGDHCQLPPTIKCIEASRGGLDHTLMEKVVQQKPSAVSLLKVQYRMHETIMQFPSDWFYHGELEAAPEVRYRGILDFDTPMNWIDTSEMDFHEDFVGESFGRINKQEANLLLQELETYIERIGKERILDERIDFGLISPYKAQVQYLRGKTKGSSFLRPFRSLITVNTVDGFQGQERDVIFISLVRANEDGQIGFLNDLRRMNVAITRARMKLVILGDASTLTKHPFYKRLMLFIKKED